MGVLTSVFTHFALAQPSQPDSLKTRELEEVVVTATRNERTMGALPMPVTLISKAQIKTIGSLRLNDVLAEQTGLVVVPQINAQGNGIQVQGFNPDYTLILIDGEPIVGRYTGSLELSRLTVGNIKQIEIVKGPSSSLYGSDALAGVINIITERPTSNRGSFSSRYGTNKTLDLTGDASVVKNKAGLYLFANRYSTDGYDLSPQNYGKTVSPFTNYTFSSKFTYKLAPTTELTLAGRYFTEEQKYDFDVASGETRVLTTGSGSTRDWNFNPELTHRFSPNFKTTARLYSTHYSTNTLLSLVNDGSPYYTDDFKQTFLRPEINAEYYINHANITTAGAGHIDESVQTSRYGDEVQRTQQTNYAFFQHEYNPTEKLTIIGGGRLDHNSVYGGQFSPKLSARYELNKKITFKVSGGLGFKSPDFRQLYFNFTNTAAGGYSVLGTEIALTRIAEMDAQGLIKGYLEDPSTIGKLKAEKSIAINVGVRAEVIPSLIADVNLFHNSIDNLIDTQIIATTTSNQSIYSYRNITRAYTQGIELNLNYPVMKKLNASVGYQLLYAKDKDVESNIEKGGDLSYYRNPETLVVARLKPSEYFGLYNRSRHQGNFKLFYNDKQTGWEGSVRVIYRGKFGLGGIRGNIQGEVVPSSDRDSNGILDSYDDFVKGYVLVNLSVAKTFQHIIRLQVGVDNLFNYTEPIYIPNLPGRLMYISASFTFNNHKSN